MSRCIACDVLLDLDNKEGWDTSMCHTCNRASYSGCVYDVDVYGKVNFIGFEPPESMSEPLGREYVDTQYAISLKLKKQQDIDNNN